MFFFFELGSTWSHMLCMSYNIRQIWSMDFSSTVKSYISRWYLNVKFQIARHDANFDSSLCFFFLITQLLKWCTWQTNALLEICEIKVGFCMILNPICQCSDMNRKFIVQLIVMSCYWSKNLDVYLNEEWKKYDETVIDNVNLKVNLFMQEYGFKPFSLLI